MQLVIDRTSAIYGRIVSLETGRLFMSSASKMQWADRREMSELYVTTSVRGSRLSTAVPSVAQSYIRALGPFLLSVWCLPYAERDLW